MKNEKDKSVYRIQGFKCAHCAQTFEENVKHLQGVTDAQVNFGAAKLTVYGNTSIVALEKAGEFEGLKVIPENETFNEVKEPFWKTNWNVLLAALFLIAGVIGEKTIGETHYATIAAFLLAIIIGGYDLFITGFKNLFKLRFDMKTLMTIAIIGASLIGEWGEGATVVILFAISEILEAYSMDKARASIQSLMDIAPKEALIRRNQQEMTIPVKEIQINDILIVKAGQKIAMDGKVLSGTSSINQAAITGESIPVAKTVGDEVFAGTLNEEGLLEVLVTKHAEDNTLSKIIHLVEEAQAERAPSQAFVDKFAKYYTPAIMLVALLVAVVPPLFDGDWSKWLYQGLAALVVGCPCALVISTPVSIVTAIGNAAKNGVLIKGGVYLEELGSLRAIAFDKTGTLTKGVPTVTDVVTFGNIAEQNALQIAAALEKGSTHPLASAILKKAGEYGVPSELGSVTDFTSITGKGISAKVDGITYYLGSPKLFAQEMISNISSYIQKFQDEGKTIVLIGTETDIITTIAISDQVRESSSQVIKALHQLGIEETIMLTGDNSGTAKAIGEAVGVRSIEAELLPEEKLSFIHKLRSKYSKVAMVGDGVNDAPALAAATVGIAMGSTGTDTALETADIALMGDELKKLPFTVELSRKTLRIIKQNITFALGIKLFALLLVVPGWLTLWIAIFADMGATFIVTLNGLRLLRVKDR